MTKKYHILIVDDHPLIIDSLVCMFDNENDFSVIGTVLVQKFSDNSISSIISLKIGVAMLKTSSYWEALPARHYFGSRWLLFQIFIELS